MGSSCQREVDREGERGWKFAAGTRFGAPSGQISIGAATELDYESPENSSGNNVYDLTLQVSDGKNADGNADTAVDDTIDVTITVTDVNELPGFGSADIELEAEENTSPNTNIGDPIAASDPESTAQVAQRPFPPRHRSTAENTSVARQQGTLTQAK